MNIKRVNNRSEDMHLDEFLDAVNLTLIISFSTRYQEGFGVPCYHAWLEDKFGSKLYLVLTDDFNMETLVTMGDTEFLAIKKLTKHISGKKLKLVGKVDWFVHVPKLVYPS